MVDLAAAYRVLEDAITDHAFPGACFAVTHRGETKMDAVGRHTYDPLSPAVTLDTWWDMASCSKVVATTTAVMMLVEQGKLTLDDPVSSVIPEFGAHGKEKVTFHNLMVHNSGLIAFRAYHQKYNDPEQVWQAVCQEELTYPTGSKMIYSDLSMIVMAKVVEKLTGQPFEEWVSDQVFRPAGMAHSGYNPGTQGLANQCAPTEKVEAWRRRLWLTKGSINPDQVYIQGEVHDPTATVLGGVAGHAGLFSTVGDLTAFMQALTGGKLVNRKTYEQFIKRDSNLSSRALGWDTNSEPSSAGNRMSKQAFGHTGYTGTCIWHDPEKNLTAILLTNRVHPTSENIKIRKVRIAFHDAVYEALT